MKPNKEQYKEIQDKIVQHLFDEAKRVTKEDIVNLIKKPESESQYHLDVLCEKKLIEHDNIVGQHHSTPAFKITKEGRKYIMER
jgi:hypothetical protein